MNSSLEKYTILNEFPLHFLNKNRTAQRIIVDAQSPVVSLPFPHISIDKKAHIGPKSAIKPNINIKMRVVRNQLEQLSHPGNKGLMVSDTTLPGILLNRIFAKVCRNFVVASLNRQNGHSFGNMEIGEFDLIKYGNMFPPKEWNCFVLID